MGTTTTSVHPSDIESLLIEKRNLIPGLDRVKAALFNLVVYIEDPKRTDYVLGICRLLIKKFPCRVILLVSDPLALGSNIDVEVDVEPVGEGDTTVSCDLIAIRHSGDRSQEVGFIVLPHLIPDLPTYAFWTGDPSTPGDFFPLIQPYISKVVFDPDSLQDLPLFTHRLLDLIEQFPGEILDLRWANMDGWRRAVAAAFNSKERIESLKETRDMHITFSYREGETSRDPRIEATYMQAWIAGVMGWKYKSIRQAVEETRIDYEGESGHVSVVLTPQHEPEKSFGSILKIVITSHQGGVVELIHDKESDHLKVKMTTPDRCDIPVTSYLPHPSREEVFASKVFQAGTSSHYLDVLHLICQMDGGVSS